MNQPANQPVRRALHSVVRLFTIILTLLIILVIVWVATSNYLIGTTETLTAADAPGQILEINGRALHVRVLGDPQQPAEMPPLLVLHGFGVSGDFWFPWIEGLAEEHTLIVPDLLGFGYSERVLEPSPDYSHQGQAALLNALLDTLGVAQVDIVAHSYGGAIASQLALDFPEKVRRIVYIAALTYDIAEGGNQTLGTLPLGIGRAVTFNILGAGPLSAVIAQQVCPNCPPEVLETRLRTTRIQGTTDALIAFSQSPDISRLPDDLPLMDKPALLIWGSADQIVPLSYGQRLAQDIDAVEFVIYPNAGHIPFLEYPSQVLDKVLNFLRMDLALVRS